MWQAYNLSFNIFGNSFFLKSVLCLFLLLGSRSIPSPFVLYKIAQITLISKTGRESTLFLCCIPLFITLPYWIYIFKNISNHVLIIISWIFICLRAFSLSLSTSLILTSKVITLFCFHFFIHKIIFFCFYTSELCIKPIVICLLFFCLDVQAI